METFKTYLQGAIETANKTEAELIQTERKDEANLQRIRANVYGICLTILEVVSKTKEDSALWEEYLHKLTNLPKNWEISYEKAKAYNDVEKILIEETKLEVLQEVKEKFLELYKKK